MEKTVVLPVIPREVAEAIERKRVRTDGEPAWTNTDFITAYERGIGVSQTSLRKIPVDALMLALSVGYEIEKTPEEKRQAAVEALREEYSRAICGCGDYGTSREGVAFSDGILYTLDMLDIEVAGVNA